ncbi:hypothetical protein MRX96_040042 [Rhipicephalus microplus]
MWATERPRVETMDGGERGVYTCTDADTENVSSEQSTAVVEETSVNEVDEYRDSGQQTIGCEIGERNVIKEHVAEGVTL